MGALYLFAAITGLLLMFALLMLCGRIEERERERQLALGSTVASVYSSSAHRDKRPAPKVIVTSLPCVAYSTCQPKALLQAWERSEQQVTQGSRSKGLGAIEGGLQCAICCCDYQPQDSVKLLPCLHMYATVIGRSASANGGGLYSNQQLSWRYKPGCH